MFRWLVTGLAGVAFTVLVITFLNLNWETWLIDNGYQRSYQLLGPAMSWVAELGASWTFAFVSGGLIGGALILWLYVALNRGDASSPADLPAALNRLLIPTAKTTAPIAVAQQEPQFSVEGFDYPFPKAVLQASIAKPKGTLEAHPSAEPHRMSIVMQVENMHHSVINEWSAGVVMVMRDGDNLNISGKLRISSSYKEIQKGKRANILILHRDISDRISHPPFLLKLDEREVPLKENAEYIISIELASGNPHPTDVLIRLNTGKDLEAEAKIIHQSV